MIEYVIGIDPDCKKSGVAFYKNEQLVGLRNWTFAEFADIFQNKLSEGGITPENCIVIVEDGNMIKTIFQKHRHANPKVYAEKGRNVGRVQQQATCMIDLLNLYGYTVYCERPRRGNWADPKATQAFKLTTGWTKQSNPETRSAAFFGHIGITHARKHNRKI